LRLGRDDGERLVVVQLACGVARDLFLVDGRKGHPDGVAPDLLMRLHRVLEVVFELLLERCHPAILPGAAASESMSRCAPTASSRWPSSAQARPPSPTPRSSNATRSA